MDVITRQDKDQNRMKGTLKYADKQGKALLSKTLTLEEQLKAELEYGKDVIRKHGVMMLFFSFLKTKKENISIQIL